MSMQQQQQPLSQNDSSDIIVLSANLLNNQQASQQNLAQLPLTTKRQGTGQLGGENSNQKQRNMMAVDIYKQALPKPRGSQVYSNGSQNLIQKIKQRKQQESAKIKGPGAASLQREQTSNNDLLINQPQQQVVNNVMINQSLQMRNVNSNGSPSHKYLLNQQQQMSSNKQILLPSSRNGQPQNANINNNNSNNNINQIQGLRVVKNKSRNNIDKRQSVSFEKQIKPVENGVQYKNPYLASAKASNKNKNSIQKFKDKSYSILANNSIIKPKLLGIDPKQVKGSSQRPSPRGSQIHIMQHPESSLNHGIQNVLNSDQKLPNLKTHHERSLERNNSVFNRKDLIKQEYTKIIETRLPNILNLMNQDKNITKNGFMNEALDYDDTELLSKMFAKDQQYKVSNNELQLTLQNKNDKGRYQFKNYSKQLQQQLSQSQSQDHIYGGGLQNIERRTSSLEYKKFSQNQVNGLNIKSVVPHTIIEMDANDEDFLKLDRLQLINASARMELISANQQLLDFHLNRLLSNKLKKKKTFQNAGEHNHFQYQHQQNYDDRNSKVVCEDIENENDTVNNTLNYEDKQDKNKRERIKQMGDPHQIMQDRLHSMNPLAFGDTMRLPVLTISEAQIK